VAAPTTKDVGSHETEVVVVAFPEKYSNVDVPIAVPPGPPHVAFTRYVPEVQQEPAVAPEQVPPPETVSWLKLPVVGLTGSLSTSTGWWLGSEMTTMTAVSGPGAGDTVPLMAIGAIPTYEAWSVSTLTLELAASAGVTREPSAKRANIKISRLMSVARSVFCA
jgi:hypothetical protein